MYEAALVFHLLGATIWTGGHLILAVVFLPKTLRSRDLSILTNFEQGFERIGIPALLTQVVTGLYMAYTWSSPLGWFDFSTNVGRHVGIKLIFLLSTFALAIHARLRIIPHLSHKNLNVLAIHVYLVTLLSVLFVLAGLSFRRGGYLFGGG